MHDVQICSRDYSGVRGAVWDYSDSQQDEEDFSTLAGAVKINRFMVMVMVIMMMDDDDNGPTLRFPGSFAICKKDELVTNYKWLQRRAGGEADCHCLISPSPDLSPQHRVAVVLQKAPSKANLKVRNHGEGPY